MTNLNERLQSIADMIEKGETAADIGTDHGYLPVYLVENGISPRAVMTDVSRPSLMKGMGNAEAVKDRIDFRAGDGLSVLRPGETDAVVIAGMGGELIREIMAADIRLTCTFSKFILQPRIKQGTLRRWLLDNGFTIVNEKLVREGRFIPEIITAVPPGVRRRQGGRYRFSIDRSYVRDNHGDGLSEVFYSVPPWIVQAEGPSAELIMRRLESEKKKYSSVLCSRTRDAVFEKNIADDIRYLERLLEVCRNG